MNELIQKDLSEPYSIYTYRYFTLAYPSLSLIATHNGNIIATCISKLDAKKNSPEEKRGYIGMLAVSTEYRKLGIARNLVAMSLQEMKRLGACEVYLIKTREIKTFTRLFLKLKKQTKAHWHYTKVWDL